MTPNGGWLKINQPPKPHPPTPFHLFKQEAGAQLRSLDQSTRWRWIQGKLLHVYQFCINIRQLMSDIAVEHKYNSVRFFFFKHTQCANDPVSTKSYIRCVAPEKSLISTNGLCLVVRKHMVGGGLGSRMCRLRYRGKLRSVQYTG